MCGFKPGDEVICIRSVHGREGMTFTVSAVCPAGEVPHVRGALMAWSLPPYPRDAIQVEELEWVEHIEWRADGPYAQWGYDAASFRKVQKRNDRLTIEAFSVIKDGGFEEPKREPAKTPEPVA